MKQRALSLFLTLSIVISLAAGMSTTALAAKPVINETISLNISTPHEVTSSLARVSMKNAQAHFCTDDDGKDYMIISFIMTVTNLSDETMNRNFLADRGTFVGTNLFDQGAYDASDIGRKSEGVTDSQIGPGETKDYVTVRTMNAVWYSSNENALADGKITVMLIAYNGAGEDATTLDGIVLTPGDAVTTDPAPSDPTPPAPALVAKPTASTVLVNGENVAFDAYNIGGNNYFKLRDLAFVLSGTETQFEVGWDAENNAISLTGGQAYTANGSEMESKGAGDKTPTATTSKIYLDGKEVSFTAYNIDGNNYFKLRDVGQAFDFNVSWDGAKNTIVIATNESYTAD